MQVPLTDALIGLQFYVTLFVLLHDWVPLGALNDVAAVRRTGGVGRLIATTLLSTLPFAFGCAASVYHAGGLPHWLMDYLWGCYGVALYGLLRTWWVPYLLIAEPARAARYQAMHGRTLAFLPLHNGMRPNTLHVTVHLAVVAVLLILPLV